MARINYKICPRCNYITQDDIPGRFCSQCGEKLLKQCKQCRNAISNPFALHCPDCGNPYPLIAAGAQAETTTVSQGGALSFRAFAK